MDSGLSTENGLNLKRSSIDKEKNGIDDGHTEPAQIAQVSAEESPDAYYIRKYGVLGPFLRKLFTSGVEARGVERVPEDERDNKNIWNNLLLWWSVNTVLTTIPIGVLAQEFYTLTLPHAIAIILCFGALGGIATSFIATLGPQTGLRTMIISRYSSGYFGCTLYSVLNILTQLGFSTTAVILGGQTLATINPGTLPLVVGIIIVAVCSLIPCFVGYELIHIYERYAWIVITIIMLFLWGLGGDAGFDIRAQEPLEDSGKNLVADVFGFGGIVFGSFTGWAPIAADYNVRLPANTPPMKVFLLTFFGLWVPICLWEILGAALMTITNPAYTNAFLVGNTGGLLGQVLLPWGGGGKFILVVLSFSIVSENILSAYSTALSIQALGRPFAMVPRFIWAVLASVVFTVAGVAGREHFSEILSNFLSILSYWTAFFIVVIAEEHFIFRRKGGILSGYNFEAYDDISRLPLGAAGIIAGCCGVAGAVVGMAQVWYIGPIASKLGPLGGDLGFEMAAAFAGIVYPPLRYIEIRYTGR